MEDKALLLIEQYADELDVAAEYLWGAMMAQAPISAVTNILIVVSVIVSSILINRMLTKKTEEALEAVPYEDGPMVGLIVFRIAASLVTAGVIIGNAHSVLAGLFNPAYWALKQLTGGFG